VQGHPEYRAPSWLMHRFSVRSTSSERKEETEKILSLNSFDLSLRRLVIIIIIIIIFIFLQA
jgi:hypothetical protein